MSRTRLLSLAAILAAFSVAAEAEEGRLLLRPVALFSEHLYEGIFAEPKGIFFDLRTQEVFVADTRNSLVGVLTPDGIPLFAFGASDKMREPVRVAVAPGGEIYVLDNERSRIKIFSYRGEYQGDLKLPGIPEKPVFGTIAVDSEGNLWVGENESGQVLSFSPDLKPRLRFGSNGNEEGQFQSIAGIAAKGDFIYVTDHQVTSVQVFDRRGNFVRGFGRHDMGIENFSLPEGVAVDSAGRIVVVDALRHEIKVFDPEGKFLGRFGGLGSKLGQIAFPSDVAIDSADRIYVVEKGNGRVQVFSEEREVETAARPADSMNSKEATGIAPYTEPPNERNGSTSKAPTGGVSK